MLTPPFTVAETLTHILVNVSLPPASTNSIEVDLTANYLRVFAEPYFLRLSFEHALCHETPLKQTLNTQECTLTVLVSKQESGTVFTELDNPSSLLSCQENWDWDQESEVLPLDSHQSQYGFGFNFSIVNYFGPNNPCPLIEIVQPDTLSFNERLQIKETTEDDSFDVDHFIHDNVSYDSYHYFLNCAKNYQNYHLFNTTLNQEFCFSNDNKMELTSSQEKSILFGLADVLIAIIYDYIVNEGDFSSESWWLIPKTCASFSCLVKFDKSSHVIRSIYRRLLTFSLCRNVELVDLVFDILIYALSNRNVVSNLLIHCFNLFQDNESSIVLNKLFLEKYLNYIQYSCTQEKLNILVNVLKKSKLKFSRSQIGLNVSEFLQLCEEIVSGEL
ncbi:hypothetical protein P9112_002348 [Eukaryota sp. TZLM1-RC]